MLKELSMDVLHQWLAVYKDERRDLLEREPEFAQWLDEHYVPVAGGWNY